ncbi:MAG TPA: response regulator [Gammaproteobacteria bacterium]|nr:response regulator [Gammaproteobacteria bacterium]
MRILLVDHSRVTQSFWRKKLSARGYDVICADDAEEALGILDARRVELALIAQTLPGMDGIALTRVMRRRPQHQATPVVLLCGRKDHKIEEEAQLAGVSAIVDKANVGALWESVARAIEEHALELTGRVLYVEDSPTAARIMLDTLESLELKVDHVTNGSAALAALERERYDLVITDERLEDEMPGSEVVEAVRNYQDGRALLPILGVSGANETDERRALFRAGITDFLAKPALPEEMIARVTSLLAARQLALAVQAQRRRLSRAALMDPLSGLLSRQTFITFARKCLARAERYQFPLALGVISINGLARINDELTYTAGDQVITAIGRRIDTTSRASDLVARHGGASFAILLDHCDPGSANARFERMIEELLQTPNLPEGITFSAGYVTLDGGVAYSIEELIQTVESARDRARMENKQLCQGTLMSASDLEVQAHPAAL